MTSDRTLSTSGDKLRPVYERFTDRARRVLVLAQEEARLLNHSFVGTEHLLLGLIHEGEGVAAKSLESLGISLEAVRAKVEETIGMAGSAPTGSSPFTPRAKKVLELALREALDLGHSHISTEHLLLGLVREGEGVASQVLVSLGADLGKVRQTVVDMLMGMGDTGAADAPTSIGSEPPVERQVHQFAAQLPRRRRYRVLPPALMLVGTGLVGFAAGWAVSHLSREAGSRPQRGCWRKRNAHFHRRSASVQR